MPKIHRSRFAQHLSQRLLILTELCATGGTRLGPKDVAVAVERHPCPQGELQSQFDALATAKLTRVFLEELSTRIKFRPALEKALTLAPRSRPPHRTSRSSAPRTR